MTADHRIELAAFVKSPRSNKRFTANEVVNMHMDIAMSTLISQLSDFHLMAAPSGTYDRMPPMRSLKKLLNMITTEFSDIECCILTGDLAHENGVETYIKLRNLLTDLSLRYYLIPGNHDNRSTMLQVFSDHFKCATIPACFSSCIGGWRLIGLDSIVEGEVFGRLDSDQLMWLSRQLKLHSDQPTIIFMHHPPISVGSPWLDSIALEKSGYFEEILTDSKQIRAICVGHIHQEFEGILAGIPVLGTPSTSVQFRPRTFEHEIDPIPPGFRLFELGDDSLKTRVIRQKM